MNLNELLRAQEHALMKGLSEEERKRVEGEKRMWSSAGGKELADVDPVAVEKEVNFDMIGGLDEHIRSLKEMVVMPLLYPEIFANFRISPPRGVLFHGPPGTGKTLMVAFFMRKGADILSKWVGESERQLRVLFEQARAWQPSIIFFDEIDGLAPVRSSKQDQIHSSIVSTLLALMDGLDSRGQVVVIGATNRIDAIDPALRRPGRFDREFYFPLPSEDARRKILDIVTKEWRPEVEEGLKDQLARETRGYCGADVKNLCTEAALNAVRRTYPQIYDSQHKLQIDVGNIKVTRTDFNASLRAVIPSTYRHSVSYSHPMPPHVQCLLSHTFDKLLGVLDVLTPLLSGSLFGDSSGDHDQEHDHNKGVVQASSLEVTIPAMNGASTLSSSVPSQAVVNGTTTSQGGNGHQTPPPPSSFLFSAVEYCSSMEPRILVSGSPGMGQTKYIAPALLERLESLKFYVMGMDLGCLFSDSTR
ncbi:ATPase AAA domain-containing protein 2B, partial [Quaeritorhiza haematococci]